MKTAVTTTIAALLALVALTTHAGDGVSQAIQALQQQWAVANYETPKDQQDKAFERLTGEAESVVQANPGRAEPLIWEAIIVSTHAGVSGGFGALAKAKRARKLLEQAEKIDPTALNGSAYTSLGSLYYKVPGWPVGFGNDDKAEAYLKKALTINPHGIDPNYFYGDYLIAQGRYAEAQRYLERALNAPARPGRELADRGRREEVQQALGRLRTELGQ